MSAGCDVIMWRRPAMVVLVLACGTLIYYHCGVRNRNFVALISDLLFVISYALGAPGPHLPLSQPHDFASGSVWVASVS
ncbi:unnamed protein product, partial [Sphagnum troendelagicum]